MVVVGEPPFEEQRLERPLVRGALEQDPRRPRGRVESVIAASSRESTGVLLIVVALIVAVVQLGPPRANHGSGPRPDALGVGGVNRI